MKKLIPGTVTNIELTPYQRDFLHLLDDVKNKFTECLNDHSNPDKKPHKVKLIAIITDQDDVQSTISTGSGDHD